MYCPNLTQSNINQILFGYHSEIRKICNNISEGDLPLPGRQGQGGTGADQTETKRDHQAAEG